MSYLFFVTLVHYHAETSRRAKYPLAIVVKVLETLGDHPLIGYDVGCTFSMTTERSSLGPAFAEANGVFCVNAFHGYSYSFKSQLEFHPNIIEGAELEDLETMERLFSITNALASITRYASAYRRRLFIKAYLTQIDEDKHLNSGTFMLNNYKQALDILDRGAKDFDQAMASLGITNTDLDQWDVEQAEFIAHIGEEDPHDLHAMVYVERLQELKDLAAKRQQATDKFNSYAPAESSAADDMTTRRAEAKQRHANERYNRVWADVCALELQMRVVTRWTSTTPEHIAAVKYLKERKYRRALKKLHKLVTSRLMELSTLNIAETSKFNSLFLLQPICSCHEGYGMRTQITRSLHTRCRAIQSAIVAVNTASVALNPPRAPINWTEVGGYQFLEQYPLLQDTRDNI